MPDIIQLLPDNIANQIAAGEVIQRPSSVVKELLENAIDAGAKSIKLIVKDSGKTLIQVVDDGVGMSELDARLCFERHATSKIRLAEDLFTINTKGFRGEALASIAAIAHVELITRQSKQEIGVRIVLNGSKIDKTEAVTAPAGTSFAVKNLFFNIPARRKFLKSDPVEFKHIVEEFHRVAIVHPDIQFVLHHNGNDVYYLTPGNHKQRLVGLFGKTYNEKLLPVNEETDFVNISGFILKAEAAKKNSGEQYLFVNQRYVKNNYLNHAIKAAFEGLLLKEQYPGYFINIEVDPAVIDINVNPTKTEVKFEDERIVYNYLKVAIKRALGVFVISPTLNFDVDTNFAVPKLRDIRNEGYSDRGQDEAAKLQRENLSAWQNAYEGMQGARKSDMQPNEDIDVLTMASAFHKDAVSPLSNQKETYQGSVPYQIHNRYLLSPIKSGFVLIDQQHAHERILYEENLAVLNANPRPTQKEMFPQIIELDTRKAQVFGNIIDAARKLGFEIEDFGQGSFVIHGVPLGQPASTNAAASVNDMIDAYMDNIELQLGVNENIARAYAMSACVKRGTHLSVDEMRLIIDKLFACATPFVSPSGHKCFINYNFEDLKEKFK